MARTVTLVFDTDLNDFSVIENGRTCDRMNRDEALSMVACMILGAKIPPYGWRDAVEVQKSIIEERARP